MKGKQEHYGEMPRLTLSQASRRINSLLNSAGHGGETKERERELGKSHNHNLWQNNDTMVQKRRVEMKDVKGKKCSFLCGYLISLSLAISTGKPKVT